MLAVYASVLCLIKIQNKEKNIWRKLEDTLLLTHIEYIFSFVEHQKHFSVQLKCENINIWNKTTVVGYKISINGTKKQIKLKSNNTFTECWGTYSAESRILIPVR